MPNNSSAYLAVEMLALLAAQRAKTVCTTQALAEWIDRSNSYAQNLLERLHCAGLVRWTGRADRGYRLARLAEDITVAEVFQVFDAPVLGRAIAPMLPTKSRDNILRGTDFTWEALERYLHELLDNVSLADVVRAANPDVVRAANDEMPVEEVDEEFEFAGKAISYTRH